MYRITDTYVPSIYHRTSWMRGDYILFARGRIVWGIKRYQMAFDVKLSEGEFE